MKGHCILFVLFIFASDFVGAQDIHWSQFSDNPLFQNPGQAGNFKGDIRLVGNYRDQWRAVTVPFQTTSVSVDGRLDKFKKIGIGGLLFHDVVGDGKLRTLEFQANANIPLNLTQDSSFTIRPGITLGINQRQINSQFLTFDNQYNGIQYDENLPSNENFVANSRTNLSTGVGTVIDWRINPKSKINTGIGFYNLNRPDQGFLGGKIRRDIRTNVHARLDHRLKKNLYLLPAFNFSKQGKYTEVVLGATIKHILKEHLGEYRAVYAGIWYRTKDAGFINVGMDYQNWFVGVSYDMNFSKLTQASNARGGLEIAIRYIHQSLRPKKIIHRVCPDFI
jgi:type IX secretion system PorP/SprF family membrane protein